MPEEVLFKSESVQHRADIAAYLRTVADNLETGEAIQLRAGDQEITMEIPDRPTFEVKAEREGTAGKPGELSIEFELEWDEDGGNQSSLEIE